jgi:FMN phosphatase YigB (HAD superfamily)
MKIKNIIFDFGGVLFDIDYHAPAREFALLGWEGFADTYTQANQHPIYDKLEVGAVEPEEFWQFLHGHLPHVTREQVERAWQSILLNPFSDRIQQLPNIKKAGYRTFLLSNTNATHVPTFEQIMEETGDYLAFKNGLEHIHYSQELGMRKPHPETFRHVCEHHGLLPSETLFIDDSIQHVQGAAQAGLHVLHWKNPSNLVTELEKWGVIF